MKKKAVLLLSLFPLLCSAQSVIYYTYDAAGNRVKREMVISQQNAPRQNTPAAHYTDDIADDYRVKLRNDGSGIISIEVISAHGSGNGTVTAYDLKGMSVAEADIAAGRASIGLSGCPTGVYILHIETDGKSTDWKIIKK